MNLEITVLLISIIGFLVFCYYIVTDLSKVIAFIEIEKFKQYISSEKAVIVLNKRKKGVC